MTTGPSYRVQMPSLGERHREHSLLCILLSLLLLTSLAPAAQAADSTTPPEDTTPPVLTLEGPQHLYLPAGDAYVEPGYSAFDEVDGDLTAAVEVHGEVIDGVGSYSIWYLVRDSAGNAAEATRYVTVHFRDLPLDQFGGWEVWWMQGLFRGCNPPENTLFCPDGFVTRGQMAALLVRYRDGLGSPVFDLAPATRDYFTDDDGHVFEDEINRLREAGITWGCNPPANSRYCPDQHLTRAQMASFLVRALYWTSHNPKDVFVDDEHSIHEQDINRIANMDVTRGCNPPTYDHFCPDSYLRRDEMAVFLYRAKADIEPDLPD
jgi:hypothetical protein